MRTKQLPVARLREFFKYSPRTGEFRYRPNRARKWFTSDRLWLSWNAQFGGKVATAVSARDGYQRVAVNQRSYLAHRVIWAMMTGAWPKEEIDHINGDRTDNRWSNLRAASRTQNARNMEKPRNNTSGVTGVHWWKTKRLWQVYGGARNNRVVKYAKTFDEAVAIRERIKQDLGMTARHGL
jgi:hypothetical protein